MRWDPQAHVLKVYTAVCLVHMDLVCLPAMDPGWTRAAVILFFHVVWALGAYLLYLSSTLPAGEPQPGWVRCHLRVGGDRGGGAAAVMQGVALVADARAWRFWRLPVWGSSRPMCLRRMTRCMRHSWPPRLHRTSPPLLHAHARMSKLPRTRASFRADPSVCMCVLFACVWSRDQRPPPILAESKQYGTVRMCRTCLVWKPARAHHCKKCGRCRLKMDHHCTAVHALPRSGNR